MQILAEPGEMPILFVEERAGTETPVIERAETIAAVGAFAMTSTAATLALLKPELGVGFEYAGVSATIGVGFLADSIRRGFQRFGKARSDTAPETEVQNILRWRLITGTIKSSNQGTL